MKDQMNSRKDFLTELEGAILSEIHHRQRTTAFQVRKAFQVSPSLEWSGSAGAVYPAISKMVTAGLVTSEATSSKLKTRLLALTEDGKTRLNDWICDPERAASVGLDPFRLRAGMWDKIAPAIRRRAFEALRQRIESEIKALVAQLRELDAVEGQRIELAMVLQRSRLSWLDQRLTEE
jgi:DNA-binding PadR family transcriptional regulator